MSTKTNKTYTIMKDGNKIKTAKSLNAAKAIADQEQAEVFCGEECVYKAQAVPEATEATKATEATEATEVSQTTEAPEEVKAVDSVHAVQSSETQSDVSDNAVTDNGAEANSAANSDSAAKTDIPSVSDMAEKPTITPAPKPTVARAAVAVEEEPRLGISIHNAPQPKYENFRLTALMNVRAEASMQSKILRTAPAGTVVQVSHIENNWMKIRNGSDFAYILYEKDGKKFAERVGA